MYLRLFAYGVIASGIFLSTDYVQKLVPTYPLEYDDYYEECEVEGCDKEEVEELYSSYQEECLSEGCAEEEVVELAGNAGYGPINGMLRAFLAYGWTIRSQDFIQQSNSGYDTPPSKTAWFYTDCSFAGNIIQSSSGFSSSSYRSIRVGPNIYLDVHDSNSNTRAQTSSYQSGDNTLYGSDETCPIESGEFVTFSFHEFSGLSASHSTTLNLPSGPIGSLNVYTADVSIGSVEAFVPNSLTTNSNKGKTCTALGKAPNEPDAFYPIEDWQNIYPTRLKINANFFKVQSGTDPHGDPCANLLGLSINDGEAISPNDEPLKTGPPPLYGDPLIFLRHPVLGKIGLIVDNNAIQGSFSSGYTYNFGGTTLPIDQAIAGVRLVKNYIVQPISGYSANSAVGRTAVGIMPDHESLKIIVVCGSTNCQRAGQGITIAQLGEYMQSLGVVDALMLDGGGSASFLYSEDGVNTTYISVEGDPGQGHRSTPNFLGIK